MSLRLNYKNIHDYENYVYIRDENGNVVRENNITVGLGFTMMAVDIGEITDENVVEFYIRQKLLFTLRGEECFTLEQIRRNIGLSANVRTEKNRAEWAERVSTGILQEWSWKAARDYEALRDEDLVKEA